MARKMNDERVTLLADDSGRDAASDISAPKPGQFQSLGTVGGHHDPKERQRQQQRPRRRRWPWRTWLFGLCVLLPTLATAFYEFCFASDQYVSELKFVISQQMPQTTVPSSLALDLGGGNPMMQMIEDSEVVVQYIKSEQIIEDLSGAISLNDIYATRQADLLSRMGSGLPREKQLLYWQNVVVPSFDMSSGIITVKVWAFSPGSALHVAQAVLASSQALVNQMSEKARRNALAYSEQTVNEAAAKLLSDEVKLADYRNKHAVLYPELSAQSSVTVGGQLTEQMSEDQATLASLLSEGQTTDSPQVQTLQANITATRAQIAKISTTIASPKPGDTQSLASVDSGYDILTATRTTDQELYNSDLLALQDARNKASEASMYLETFVQPSEPESSIYPERGLVTCEIAFAGVVGWVLLILLVNTILDQND